MFLSLSSDELLSAAEVIGRTREGSVGHDVYSERGHVGRPDGAPDGKRGTEALTSLLRLSPTPVLVIKMTFVITLLLVFALLTQARPTLYEPAPPPASLEKPRRSFLHVPVEYGNRMRLATQKPRRIEACWGHPFARSGSKPLRLCLPASATCSRERPAKPHRDTAAKPSPEASEQLFRSTRETPFREFLKKRVTRRLPLCSQ